ncbi:hypothetical protein NE237_027126 [Protea cynaroides]|uniref:Uncharacterized protein n=1 Tax=Protea cynaroides TaxID=273540 RepID=A0A9Q0GMZ2_9MAGN|nr:hypothetical protein NE237_027126 [Protea cynaroides]
MEHNGCVRGHVSMLIVSMHHNIFCLTWTDSTYIPFSERGRSFYRGGNSGGRGEHNPKDAYSVNAILTVNKSAAYAQYELTYIQDVSYKPVKCYVKSLKTQKCELDAEARVVKICERLEDEDGHMIEHSQVFVGLGYCSSQYHHSYFFLSRRLNFCLIYETWCSVHRMTLNWAHLRRWISSTDTITESIFSLNKTCYASSFPGIPFFSSLMSSVDANREAFFGSLWGKQIYPFPADMVGNVQHVLPVCAAQSNIKDSVPVTNLPKIYTEPGDVKTKVVIVTDSNVIFIELMEAS